MSAVEPKWMPFNGTTGMAAERIRQHWWRAVGWLNDFGISLMVDVAMPPDAMACTGIVTYAFRIDREEGGPSVIVTVEIDEDPPARAVRVEVKRGYSRIMGGA